MEPIQRLLMMLRPDRAAAGCEGDTPLRMQATPDGIALTLRAACLSDGDYDTYLFLKNGRYVPAGKMMDGSLQSDVAGITIEDIKGAAVVQSQSGRHTFCLKSTGMDWDDAIARFKITHSQQTKPLEIKKAPDAQAISAQQVPDLQSSTVMPSTQADPPPPPPSSEDAPHSVQDNEPSACDMCPHAIKQHRINPFPAVFPGSEWVKISYPGPTGWWHYISGTIYRGGTTAKVLGVPGEYSMAPPIWLEGFGTYLRSAEPDARGYWLMFQDAETGEVLDMDLSRRGV